MWVLLGPGDAAPGAVAVVPDPHLGPAVRRAPTSARSRCRHRRRDFFERRARGLRVLVAQAPGDRAARSRTTPRPRASTSTSSSSSSTSPASTRSCVVHDNAYAELGFDGYQPPSILQAEGAKECAVELYSMTKSFSMAGWRVAFLVGNAEVVQALAKLKSYLDYGTFQPIQIAATVTLNEAPDYPEEVQRDLPGAGATRCATGSTASAGRSSRPRGTMFAWAPIPEPYREMGSIEFASMLVREAQVAVSPGRRLRPRRRRLRALRPHRERAAHRSQALRNLRRSAHQAGLRRAAPGCRRPHSPPQTVSRAGGGRRRRSAAAGRPGGRAAPRR